MNRLAIVFGILLLSAYINAQNVGGTNGPCSAVEIPAPYTKPITLFGSNVGATTYNTSSTCVGSNSGVVWYIISPPVGVNISLSTCASSTNFDTVISVYIGNCSSLICSTYNDDSYCPFVSGSSNVSFVTTTSRYYVGVGGYSSASGTFQLTLTQNNHTSNTTTNPGCGSATPLYGPYNGIVAYSTNNISTGVVDFNNTSCQINFYQFSAWFQIFPVIGQLVNVSTCNGATNFDTILTVVAGSNCNQLNCTARNDDGCLPSYASALSFLPETDSYFVIVSGYSSSIGTFELSVYQSAGSGGGSNQACNNASVIYPGNSYYGSTFNISPYGFNDACARYSNRSAVWFHLQTENTGSSLTLTTCNSYTDFDTVIIVYGGNCSNLSCVAYNDDATCSTGSTTKSTVVFYPTTTSYYVVVASYSSTNGDFLLIVS